MTEQQSSAPEAYTEQQSDTREVDTEPLLPLHQIQQHSTHDVEHVQSTAAHTCRRPVMVIAAVVAPLALISFIVENTLHRPTNSAMKRGASHVRVPVAQTILISVDGFRHDYLFRVHPKSSRRIGKYYVAPNLRRIGLQGAMALQGMLPVMPSKTIPNHWSLVTGLYPESSGLIGNVMYDPVTKQWFRHADDQAFWWHGQPIWQTLRLNRKEHSTAAARTENYTAACVFWPGCTAHGHRPNAYWHFNASIPYKTRVDRAVSLLSGTAPDLKDKSADFVTLYFERVDHAGHKYGPDSAAVNAAIEDVDAAVGYLLAKLGPNYAQKYNIIVISDHGMTELSSDRVIDINDVLPDGKVQDVELEPLGSFRNVSVPAEVIYKKLRNYFAKLKADAKVYTPTELPKEYHLSSAKLICPILTLMPLGWIPKYKHQTLFPDKKQTTRTIHSMQGAPANLPLRGQHGYDYRLKDMRALFLAQGPSFRNRSRLRRQYNINVYAMMCRIFNVKPAPNNGSAAEAMAAIIRRAT